ncbi:MAG: hypothetical protein KIT83_11160, partial [Bryobacterales bacterium]|nr:hypothetical protein [Bryobacterales bacterium]
LAGMGADLLVETLARLETGTLGAEAQDHAAATYAPMLKREDGLARWQEPATVVYNRYRGFQPWPGAYTYFRGTRFQLKEMRLGEECEIPPGTVFAQNRRLFAACGDGRAVELIRVQQEGKGAVSAEAFLNGVKLQPGERFTETPLPEAASDSPEKETNQ